MTSDIRIDKLFSVIYYRSEIDDIKDGWFIKNFAGLWLSANEKQKELLKPSAQRLIMRYSLERVLNAG